MTLDARTWEGKAMYYPSGTLHLNSNGPLTWEILAPK